MKKLVVLAIALIAACGGEAKDAGDQKAADKPIIVATAASLRVVMPEIIGAFGGKVDPSYGASGELKRQVEAGAPIDAVIFASAEPVDKLIAEKHAVAASRVIIGSNQLVIVVPKGKPRFTFQTLGDVPAGERIAIGETATVPAGQYAKEALTRLGKWDALEDRLVMGADVAAVLAYARRGEVAAAIVYRTDAMSVSEVEITDTAAGDWAPHPVIVAAVVNDTPQANAFVKFLRSDQARKALAAKGFGPP